MNLCYGPKSWVPAFRGNDEQKGQVLDARNWTTASFAGAAKFLAGRIGWSVIGERTIWIGPKPSAMDIPPFPLRNRGLPHSSHWGAFGVLVGEPGSRSCRYPEDPDPSPLLGNIAAAVAHPARVARPMVRRGWLEDGPGPDRSPRPRRIRGAVVAAGTRPRRRRIAAGVRGLRAARGVRRLLWLGERRPLSRRAEPDPPLSEPRRRLCPLGRQLQLGCGERDPAACPRAAEWRSPATASAGTNWSPRAPSCSPLAAWR